MLTIIDLRKKNFIDPVKESDPVDDPAVNSTVGKIIADIRKDGDAALRRYTRKFDGATVHSFLVDHNDLAHALKNADKRFVKILGQAAANIRRFHKAQVRKGYMLTVGSRSRVGQRWTPVSRVGVYVPGGKAVYPSTVLMNVIPAQVAGVKEIHLVSPPDNKGYVHPDVLTAAALLGVTKVYRVGGAQSIAALAYGTESIPAVDKIVGPGNIYVAAAKRRVFGKVGIDSIAGPSEVVILADSSANPTFVASDLLAQAEHDERAVPILVTPSLTLANQVKSEVDRLWKELPRKELLERSLRGKGKIFVTASLRHAIDITNQLAPEHLEIITTRDEEVLRSIEHAGSIFLGNYSPVAIGDYFAGPNHVLPTERTARFSSPLSVDDFMKKSGIIRFTAERMAKVADDVAYFAEREGLTAHALSLRLRKGASK